MIENEFEKMFNDLDSLNDDFVTGYFSEEEPLQNVELENELTDEENNLEIFTPDNLIDEEIEEKTLEEKNKELQEELSWEMNVENNEIDNSEFDSNNMSNEMEDSIKQNDNLSDVYNTDELSDKIENEDIEKYKNDESQEEKVYHNRFTSFSKTNLSKIYHKKIIVDRKINFKNTKDCIKKSFSYNDILDRLDNERKIDINNVNDLMKLIDKCNNYKEFFDVAESEFDDK